MPRVFISHSSLDRDFAEGEIVPTLHAAGIDTWYSKTDLRAAEQWEPRIRKSLKECDWFLVIISPRSVTSKWVVAEVHWAMENRDGRVIPVLLEDCDRDLLHLRMSPLQFIDFRPDQDRASARKALISVMRHQAAARDVPGLAIKE